MIYENDDEDDGETLTMPCSSCGSEVYKDAERCPACGDYITHSSSVWQGRPLPWIVLGVLGIAAVVFVLVLWNR